MSFATIDDFAFITLKGQVQPFGLAVEDITRAGVDGVAYREMALRAPPFELIGIRDHDDFDAAAGFVQDISALQGRLVTIVDDYSREFPNVLMLSAVRLDLRPILSAVGGIRPNPKAMLTMRFVMQLTQLAGT